MASLINLSSSPDPLGDEAPSSIRTITRRTAGNLKSHPRESSLQVPSSIKPRSSAKSPRKQTFELDVGNGRSPQRLLVTVEAEDDRGRRSGVNRRLFSASPSRSVSRRREATTTTVVPLRGLTDDEGGNVGDDPTPRRRGRPRVSLGSKNGTPAPRGKKRAGTPLYPTFGAKRLSAEIPSSDATLMSNVLVEGSGNTTAEPTLKPKTRARKTPKKASTPALPSSKATGRKRGRPRKALMPSEVADLTSEIEPRTDDVDNSHIEDLSTIREAHSEANSQSKGDSPFGAQHYTNTLTGSRTLEEDSIQGFSSRQELRRSPYATQSSGSSRDRSTQEARIGAYDEPVFDDFTGEHHSDLDSEIEDGDGDGATFSGQDNLTHASDFSMIAVEELPSFQASFQGNRSGLTEVPPRFAEAGDETNFIINQTLESLRRSTQNESHDQPDPEDVQKQQQPKELPVEEHEPIGQVRNSPSMFGSSQLSWSRSPRRLQKTIPLSKQVLINRAPHIDSSISSMPDSALHTATPGSLSTKPPSAHLAEEDSNMYEDSFSEIPEEILAAATPKPVRTVMEADQNDFPSPDGEAQSASRSTNIGSDRLPTPDDTNSSTTDAKNGHGEDTNRLAIGSAVAINTSDLNIRSSPPTISRQFNTMNIQSESAHTISRHFDTMALQSEQSEQSRADQTMAGTPLHKTSSPNPALADSGSAENAHTLLPPQPSRRPTLSPIVRAGRTLQNILSDKSSPDDHGSLGSPFRGSLQSNSRQSSISRSPTRAAIHRRTGSDSRALFSSKVLSQSIRSTFASSQRASSLPAPDLAQIPVPVSLPAYVASAAPAKDTERQSDALKRLDYGIEKGSTNIQTSRAEAISQVPSSARRAPSIEQSLSHETSSVLGQDDPSSPATQRSRRIDASIRAANSSALSSRGFRSSQLRETILESEFDQGQEHDDKEQDVQTEEGQFDEPLNEPLEEQLDEQAVEDYDEQIEEEHIFDDLLDQEDSLSVEQDDGLRVVGQGGSNGEREGSIPVETSEADYDEVDLWDIEASRPTPRANRSRQPRNGIETLHAVPTVASAQISAPAVDANPPRRNKIPSPWRRNARRLIYQDDFRSPSEIDMEDSPPNDAERAISIPPFEAERANLTPQVEAERSPADSRTGSERTISDQRSEQERVVQPSPEPTEEEADTDPEQTDDGNEDEYSYELMERDESDEPEAPTQALRQPEKESPMTEHSVLQEYSMDEVNQVEEDHEPEPEPEPEQPAPTRRSFFGRGFDILSFFSSPRPPPTTNDPSVRGVEGTPAHQTTVKPLPRSAQSIQNSLPEEPQSALRATGLFPSIRQKTFNPSPERRADLFSPGTTLRSNDTVADTYDEAPSTPDGQRFEPIPQKRNFTPLSGRSRNTASLFTSSSQGSTSAQDARTPSPEYDDLRENDYSNDEAESMLADGPSFEHIPPREKPSQWDKNLSPTKSCMRSPLKPKTPGRVVEFTSSVLSAGAQEKARVDRQRVLNTISNASVNIATSNPRTAILNPSPLRVSTHQPRGHDKENTLSSSKSPERQLHHAAQVIRIQGSVPTKLSSTTWSRAHWVRLDEILQLRKRDPMHFQMVFPALAPHKHPLAGLEVATQDAKLVLEDWHLEVVEAFRSELTTASKSFGADQEVTQNTWDDKALSKRLFALIVGEERRRSGKYVSARGS